MSMSQAELVAAKWDKQAKPASVRSNYWQFPEICGHLNTRICGKALPGVSDGTRERLKSMGPFPLAVSVGCGRATKEAALLADGVVDKFVLYDLSPARLEEAARLLEKRGVRDRAELVCADAFATPVEARYDLVYWASSLHHMPDVHAALEWSRNVLRPGGMLSVWEYVGPTRWQFSDEHLRLMNAFRAALPKDIRPKNPVQRRSVSEMIARDPSEAADSAEILPALEVQFPGAEVIMLGGGLYSHGLAGILAKLEPKHAWVFDMIMAMDAAMTDHQVVAAAFARKLG